MATIKTLPESFKLSGSCLEVIQPNFFSWCVFLTFEEWQYLYQYEFY